MSPARFASQLDPIELEEFQEAARTLIAHPLVTATWPGPEALPRIRRWEPTLRTEFERLARWRLDVGPTVARLVQRRVEPSPHRPPAATAGGADRSRRPFGRLGYVLLCLVLAALEAEGGQTTIQRLIEGVARVRAGDDGIPVDFGRVEYRRAFVHAVGYLERLGVLLTAPDGETAAFIDDEGADALYTIDHDAARRMLGPTPGLIDPEAGLAQFCEDRYPPGVDMADARLRHRLARRILLEPAVYVDELPADEREHLAERRGRLVADLERLTGCAVEIRAEGLALLDTAGSPRLNDVPFPGTGAVNNVALLLADELTARAGGGGDGAGGPVGRRLAQGDVAAAWAAVVARHGDRFPAAYRADPDSLLGTALGLLQRLGLVVPAAEDGGGRGGLALRPLAARFRPSGTHTGRRRR